MDKLLDKRIGRILEELSCYITPVRLNVTGWKTLKCGYKTDNTVPSAETGTWNDFGETEIWGTDPEEHRWFYKKIFIPEEMRGKDTELYVAATDTGESDWEPQFLIYVDGKAVRGMDSNHRYVTLDSSKESCDVHVYAYSSPKGRRVSFYSALCECNRDVEKLYYDIKVPFDVMEYLDKGSKEFGDIMLRLNNAVSLINWCDPLSEEFISSVRAASSYMDSEFYGKFCGRKDITVDCFGHTHIDVAWKWTLDQTREKIQRTFGSVIENMKKYPDYRFMSSQPQLFRYLKSDNPEMFEEIKRLVKEGRIELEGSMWLEADCNLSSGESLVRQIMHGKRFFKEEFGVDNHIVWLPDVFGYSAAMPQIMKKGGIDKFVTSKIGWNETNRLPYDTFYWQGIDGTKVFTYFLTAVRRTRNFEKMRWRPTYTPELRPNCVQGAWDRYEPKALTEEIMMPFGYGDGGGGPSSEDLEYFSRIAKGIPGCPCVKWNSASDFLNSYENRLSGNKRLPVWVGELYLEFHRGTYTSQAANKKNNRKSELLYQRAETAAVMAGKLLGREYPSSVLNEGWECILLNQFHDIIPGSSIHSVYERCKEDYKKIFTAGAGVEDDALKSIASNIRTSGGTVVFNPNSFEANGFLNHNGRTYRVSGIPSKGYKVVNLTEEKPVYRLEGKTLTTSNYVAVFDDNYVITRLFDIKNNREVLTAGGRANYIEVFEDYPYEYDAWEISKYYTEKKYELDNVDNVEFVEEGARFGFVITRKFYKSVFRQKIYFYDGSNRIDFETDADWHQEHMMVKAAFDVDVNADKATYEIQFGSVERPTHRNTSWESAKFEVCAHKFMDISDYGYGVSLLNDCKYGHNVEGRTIKLSLFKCATYPDENADKGRHVFTYSLLPHSGDFRNAGVIKAAYELNNPLSAADLGRQNGFLDDSYSLLQCSNENFVVETIKKAEKEDAVVVRGYESFNRKSHVKYTLGFDAERAFICDLNENNLSELEIKNRCLEFDAEPFELITVKIL